jgi:hypothetical protein
MRLRIGVVQSTSSVDFLGMDIMGDWFAIASKVMQCDDGSLRCDCLATAWEANERSHPDFSVANLNTHVVCAKARFK